MTTAAQFLKTLLSQQEKISSITFSQTLKKMQEGKEITDCRNLCFTADILHSLMESAISGNHLKFIDFLYKTNTNADMVYGGQSCLCQAINSPIFFKKLASKGADLSLCIKNTVKNFMTDMVDTKEEDYSKIDLLLGVGANPSDLLNLLGADYYEKKTEISTYLINRGGCWNTNSPRVFSYSDYNPHTKEKNTYQAKLIISGMPFYYLSTCLVDFKQIHQEVSIAKKESHTELEEFFSQQVFRQSKSPLTNIISDYLIYIVPIEVVFPRLSFDD